MVEQSLYQHLICGPQMENPSKLSTLEVRLYTEHENASFSGLLDASSRHQWSSCVLLTAQVTNHNPLHILSNSQEDMGHQSSGALSS